MPQSLTNLLIHAVWSTRHRAPLISSDAGPRLHAYIGGIVENTSGVLLAAGGVEDHLHLLISQRPTVALSDAIRDIKANSSRWLRDTFKLHDFAWQNGYAAFAVSASNSDAVRHYINTQPEHHRRMSFKEEYIQLLERHGLKYDERYVWG